MMIMGRTTFIVASVSLVLVLAGPAWADRDIHSKVGKGHDEGYSQGAPHHKGYSKSNTYSEGHAKKHTQRYETAFHYLHSILRHQEGFGLSTEQVRKIEAITMEYSKAHIRAKADMEVANIDVTAAAMDEKVDLAHIEAAVRKAEAADVVLRMENIKATRAVTALLTPEQREKAKAVRAKMMHHRFGEYGKQ